MCSLLAHNQGEHEGAPPRRVSYFILLFMKRPVYKCEMYEHAPFLVVLIVKYMGISFFLVVLIVKYMGISFFLVVLIVKYMGISFFMVVIIVKYL